MLILSAILTLYFAVRKRLNLKDQNINYFINVNDRFQTKKIQALDFQLYNSHGQRVYHESVLESDNFTIDLKEQLNQEVY